MTEPRHPATLGAVFTRLCTRPKMDPNDIQKARFVLQTHIFSLVESGWLGLFVTAR